MRACVFINIRTVRNDDKPSSCMKKNKNKISQSSSVYSEVFVPVGRLIDEYTLDDIFYYYYHVFFLFFFFAID